jgi:hypothetical protein
MRIRVANSWIARIRRLRPLRVAENALDRDKNALDCTEWTEMPCPSPAALYLPPSAASGRARTTPGNLGRTGHGGLRGFARFAEIG